MLLVGVFVVVDVLVAGFSDAHELSMMAESKSTEVRMIGLFMGSQVLIASVGNDHSIDHHVVAFSYVVNANLGIFSDCRRFDYASV